MATTQECCMLFSTNPGSSTLQNSNCTATYLLTYLLLSLSFYSLWVFQTNVNYWAFTEFWVTASLLKSPRLFSVFWPVSIVLWSERSRFFLQFSLTTLVSSSSSCRAISIDIPDPLSPPLPIVHQFRQVLRATPCILTELLYVGSSWSTCFCSAMWRGP